MCQIHKTLTGFKFHWREAIANIAELRDMFSIGCAGQHIGDGDAVGVVLFDDF